MHPAPTEEAKDGQTRSVTWETFVPKGKTVNNVITFRRP